jgi:hypothetical protein
MRKSVASAAICNPKQTTMPNEVAAAPISQEVSVVAAIAS